MNRLIRYTYPRSASQIHLFANRSPWSGLESEVDRLFESAFADLAVPAFAPRFPVDLYDDKDNTYVRAALPGVSRDAISIELVDGTLDISATRQQGDESSSLSRSIALPEAVQTDKVTATYENGILTVTLPKQEQVKPRKIDITVN
jgi:HSP20 family protein